MKKFFFSALFIALVISFVSVSCTRKSPTGATDVTPTPTITATPTPNINFTVYAYNDGSKVTGLNMQMSNGTFNTLSKSTNINGISAFTLHSTGPWTILIPAQYGYDNLNYIVDATSTTCFAFDLGAQSLSIALSGGSESLTMAPSTISYTVTFVTGATKKYNLQVIGLPAGITATISPSQVQFNGDTATVVLTVPKSFENFNGVDQFQFWVKGTDTQPISTTIQTQQARTVTRGWHYNIYSDITIQKIGQCGPYGCVNQYMIYYVGANNFTYEAQGTAMTQGNIVRQIISAALIGDHVDYISDPVFASPGSAACTIGNYESLATFVSTDYNISTKDQVWGHWGLDGTITVRFTDDANLDVTRTFTTTSAGNGWGSACGRFHQTCQVVTSGDFDKCGSYPNTWGCSYSVHMGHCEKTNRILGTK